MQILWIALIFTDLVLFDVVSFITSGFLFTAFVVLLAYTCVCVCVSWWLLPLTVFISVEPCGPSFLCLWFIFKSTLETSSFKAAASSYLLLNVSMSTVLLLYSALFYTTVYKSELIYCISMFFILQYFYFISFYLYFIATFYHFCSFCVCTCHRVRFPVQ